MNKAHKKILITDDEMSHRVMLRANLESAGYQVFEANHGKQAVALVSEKSFDFILMDIRMPVMDGISALKEIKIITPQIPVVMMTAFASIKTAVESLKSGAEDYLLKPVNVEEMLMKIEKTLEKAPVTEKPIMAKPKTAENVKDNPIIGSSTKMADLAELITMVAPTDATVLILGESGTGKELVANALHVGSDRKDGPFMKVNCAALHENLLESELFGHEKGAFTGAVAKKDGRFKAADGGTIFLDEVAEMSKATQAKLLRVLQEKEFEPLGSNRTTGVDVRVIAATNKNLEEEVALNEFREDLFYRLNVVPITVPPLRERKEDIPLLLDHFREIYTQQMGKSISGFDPQALSLLSDYEWPGNVRELENVVERSIILSKHAEIGPEILPQNVARPSSTSRVMSGKSNGITTLKDAEKELIMETLRDTGGNRTRSAQILGITRKTLQNKIKEFGIDL